MARALPRPREGTQESYPRKEKKTTGALRFGAAFVAVRADGTVLLRTRPPKGLLGGMTEPPGDGLERRFRPRRGGGSRAAAAEWRRCIGVVEHTFTHFPLRLTVFRADLPAGTPAPEGCRWMPVATVDGEALPTVMRKAVALGLGG